MEFDDAMTILAALETEGVAYVLIGGMGMAVHGLVRATRDIDLFVAPTADNVARLRRALAAVFDDSSIAEITAEALGGDYPAIEYVPPDGRFSIDLIARLGEAFAFTDIEWESVLVGGVQVRVATPAMLRRMKRDTVRGQDKLDAEWLRRVFELE